MFSLGTLCLFGGFGIEPAPAPTPAYVPPGAAYASFPGLEGGWKVFRQGMPLADLEFWTEGGELRGKWVFSDISSFLIPQQPWPWTAILQGELPLYGISVDWDANKITFRFYSKPSNVTGATIWTGTIHRFEATLSVIGNQLVGTLEDFVSVSGLYEEGIHGEVRYQVPGEPVPYDNTAWYYGGLLYINAMKVSQPAFVPAIVVVRSPTPGQTIEVTVPVVTVPEETHQIQEPAPQNPQPVTDVVAPQSIVPVEEVTPVQASIAPEVEKLEMPSAWSLLTKQVSIAGLNIPFFLIIAGLGIILLVKKPKYVEHVKPRDKRRKKNV